MCITYQINQLRAPRITRARRTNTIQIQAGAPSEVVPLLSVVLEEVEPVAEGDETLVSTGAVGGAALLATVAEGLGGNRMSMQIITQSA